MITLCFPPRYGKFHNFCCLYFVSLPSQVYRESLRGGGDWGSGPVVQGLLDEDPGADEAGQDYHQPHQARQSSGLSDVGQPVDGGGSQELLQSFHVVTLLSPLRGRSIYIGGVCTKINIIKGLQNT